MGKDDLLKLERRTQLPFVLPQEKIRQRVDVSSPYPRYSSASTWRATVE